MKFSYLINRTPLILQGLFIYLLRAIRRLPPTKLISLLFILNEAYREPYTSIVEWVTHGESAAVETHYERE